MLNIKQSDGNDLRVDRNNLFKEESFTDLKVASIKRLTPVKPDGTVDKTRDVRFTGYSQVILPTGAMPIQFVIEAKTLQEAMDKFPDALEIAVHQMIEEMKEFEREQASRIIVPGIDPKGRIQL